MGGRNGTSAAPADHSQAWLDIVGPLAKYFSGTQTPEDRANYALQEVANRPSSPLEVLSNYFTAGAAQRQQHEQDLASASLVGRDMPYLATQLARQPEKIAAVQAAPDAFARAYAATNPADRSAPLELPPSALPPRAGQTPTAATQARPDATAAAALSPAQSQAAAQVDYISALRHNPALKGMKLGQLQAYIGLQPASGKNPTGKDNAINTVLALGQSEFAVANQQATALAATDPAKAAERRSSAAAAWRDLVLRVAAQPDPTGDLLAASREAEK